MTIANTISSIILCFDTLVIAKIRLTKIMQYRRPAAIPNQRIQWYFVIGEQSGYRITKPTIARMIVTGRRHICLTDPELHTEHVEGADNEKISQSTRQRLEQNVAKEMSLNLIRIAAPGTSQRPECRS